MTDNPHIGPLFNDWLKEEGLYEEATEEAQRRLDAWLANTSVITLGPEDSRIFAEALLNPREPNDKLREAFEKYGRNVISRDIPGGPSAMRPGPQIYWVPIESVRMMDDNPPRRTKEGLVKFKDLLRSMQQRGFDANRPLLISNEGIIGDGNRRYKAAMILGLKEVAVIFTSRPYPELFEGNTGADAISNFDWLVTYVNGIAYQEKMPREVASHIRQCETAGGRALLEYLVESRVSPRVSDTGYTIGAYCERTEYPFVDKAIRWIVAHRNQDHLNKLMRHKLIPPRVLAQAVEHDLDVKESYLAIDEDDE